MPKRECPKKAIYVITQFLKDKKRGGALKQDFLCFAILSTCLCHIMHKAKLAD